MAKMVTLLIFLSLLMTPALAFFRDLCFNPLGYGRIDPIISPGQPSQHLHHLHGSGNLGIDSVDADYLLQSNCTSCSITADKSAYWAPAMYFQHENGTFELLTTAGSLTIYYKTEKRANVEDRNYTAFPKNFRMVAGDSLRRNWVGPWPIPAQSFWGPDDTSQAALASKSLGFNCMNYNRVGEPTFAFSYLRDKTYTDANCLNGIRAEVLFPSCWDGKNLDSADHKSHVAYPNLLQDGLCPTTHPVLLPVLFYETIWNTQQFIGIPGRYVFSNGDPTGYGYHGDFLAAWEDGVLDAAIADSTCTDHNINNRHSDGEQEHCPVFAGRIQSQEEAAKCKLDVPEKLFHEKFAGSLAALPGNMPVSGERHDPGTSPDDFKYPKISPTSLLPSSVGPIITPSSASHATSNSSVPIVATSTSSVSSSHMSQVTTSVHSPTPIVGATTITSTFVSNGVKYELVEIEQIITVTNTKHATTVVTTTADPSSVRFHPHGRAHRAFA